MHIPGSLMIIPTGASPLPNTEVRALQNIPFPGTSTTLSFNLNYPETSTFVAVVRSYFLSLPDLLRHFLISPQHCFCRSATRAGLVLVAQAILSPFSNHQTRVVTVPLTPARTLGGSISTLKVDSHNVIQYGCGGTRLSSMGVFLHQSFVIRCGLTAFIHDTYRHCTAV